MCFLNGVSIPHLCTLPYSLSMNRDIPSPTSAHSPYSLSMDRGMSIPHFCTFPYSLSMDKNSLAARCARKPKRSYTHPWVVWIFVSASQTHTVKLKSQGKGGQESNYCGLYGLSTWQKLKSPKTQCWPHLCWSIKIGLILQHRPTWKWVTSFHTLGSETKYEAHWAER